MAVTYLIIGSNLGDKVNYLKKAILCLSQETGSILRLSSIYESAPWGFDDNNVFLNQIIELNTSLSPLELLIAIHNIENALGRVRGNIQYSSRTIDIDILFYENIVFNSDTLTIPHLQIEFRRFVLVPMNELSPEFIHPSLKLTIFELLENCLDDGYVRLVY